MKNLLSSMRWAVILGLVALHLAGCGEGAVVTEESAQPKQAATAVAKESVQTGPEKVLARVNGTPITEGEVNQAIRRMWPGAGETLEQADQRKVLESLVASRALAQAAEKKLSADTIALVDAKVKAYREELLTMEYVQHFAPPRSVTPEMARQYYQEHPEKFGAGTPRGFEMIVNQGRMTMEQRDGLHQALQGSAKSGDWRQWATELNKEGYPVSYQQGRLPGQIVEKRLVALMAGLKDGETSTVTSIDGNLYLVRMREREAMPPSLMKEIEKKVEKTLVLLEFDKSLKKAREEVMKRAETIYE